MKYILLDTSVLVNCTLVNATDAAPELLVALVDRMRDQGAKLLLPDVVRFEYARKVPEELALIRQQTKKFRDSVTTSVLPGPDVSTCQLHKENRLNRIKALSGKRLKLSRPLFLDFTVGELLRPQEDLQGSPRCKTLPRGSSHGFCNNWVQNPRVPRQAGL